MLRLIERYQEKDINEMIKKVNQKPMDVYSRYDDIIHCITVCRTHLIDCGIKPNIPKWLEDELYIYHNVLSDGEYPQPL